MLLKSADSSADFSSMERLEQPARGMSTARNFQDYLGAVAQADRRHDANAYHYALVELGAYIYALNQPALTPALTADASPGRG